MTVLPRVAYRMTASCVVAPKKSQQFIHDVLSAGDVGEDDPVLGSVSIDELIPPPADLPKSSEGGLDVTIRGPLYNCMFTGATSILMEVGSLAYIVRALRARRVFEFGTFIGRTTRMFAMNAPDAEIFTLDLPEGILDKNLAIGRDFIGTPEASRIHRLTGDTRTFDYAPYHGTADFVWVDACHDYEFVVNDTAAALKVVRPGGWIGWHDYRHTAWWAGVTRHLREIYQRFPLIKHIRGTTMAVARVPG